MLENERIMIISQALIINYPLLKMMGRIPSSPIALVFNEPGNIRKFLDSYPLPAVVIDSASSTETMKSILTDTLSDQAFLIGSPTRHVGKGFIKKINLLVEAAVVGSLENQSCCMLPVALFNKCIPAEYETDFFVIYIPDVVQTQDITEWLPLPEEIDIVKEKVQQLPDCGFANNLLAALEILRIGMLKRAKEPEFLELCNMAHILCERNENRRETGEICTCFLKEVFEWRDRVRPSFIDINCIRKGQTTFSETDVFYDENYIYIMPEILREILFHMSDIYGIDTVKQTLKKAEYLICNDDWDYSVKKTFHRNFRPRVYRFDSLMLEDRNGRSFIQMQEDRK